MKKMKIEFETENDGVRSPSALADILDDISEQLRNHNFQLNQEMRIRDINGNTIGYWIWEKEKK